MILAKILAGERDVLGTLEVLAVLGDSDHGEKGGSESLEHSLKCFVILINYKEDP